MEHSVHKQKAEIGKCQQVTTNPKSKTRMGIDNGGFVSSKKVTDMSRGPVGHRTVQLNGDREGGEILEVTSEPERWEDTN